MFKNKIANKLSLYFAVALVAFTMVIVVSFVVLFRQSTVATGKAQLQERTVSAAKTMSDYINGSGGFYRMKDLAVYLGFLEDLNLADVWMIDDNLQIYTAGNNQLEFDQLPQNANEMVVTAFKSNTVISESFSTVLGDPAVTVATPVFMGRQVVGVLLMHSPLSGFQDTIYQGIKIIAIGAVMAFVLCLILSVWLSKNFTDPIVVKEAQDTMRLERLRRDYVANISHELKTPVTVIRGSLEALVDGVVSEPVQVAEYHKEMLNETVYLQRMVGDLLDLSRLQNTDFVVEKQGLSLVEVLEDAVRSAGKLAREREVEIQADYRVSNIDFQGDYGRLRQMFLIILDNAIKFSAHGGKVEVVCEKGEVTIRDYGVGISPEQLPHIFERFYKSGSEQNKSGTGLGLAIAKEIAQRHGMKIGVRSVLEQGAQFIFKF